MQRNSLTWTHADFKLQTGGDSGIGRYVTAPSHGESLHTVYVANMLTSSVAILMAREGIQARKFGQSIADRHRRGCFDCVPPM